MPEKLDPYQAWLGIPPAEQPPNHYRLLGIPLFDGDHRTINAAAERQLALVAAAQTSGNAAIARHIVEQIKAARSVLLAHDAKRGYDVALKERLSRVKPVSTVPQAVQPNRARPIPKAAVAGVIAVCLLVVSLIGFAASRRSPVTAASESQAAGNSSGAEASTTGGETSSRDASNRATLADGTILEWENWGETYEGYDSLQPINVKDAETVVDYEQAGLEPNVFLRGIRLDAVHGRMYWIGESSKVNHIRSADLNGGDIQSVADLDFQAPMGLAVDSVNKKVYWSTNSGPALGKNARAVWRADFDGLNIEPIFTGLGMAFAVAIDPTGEQIFYFDDTRLIRAALDGSVESPILNAEITPGPGTPSTPYNSGAGAAIDGQGQKLYWAGDRTSIARSNLDGTDFEIPLELGQGLGHISGIGLDVKNGRIYFVNRSYEDMWRVKFDGSDAEVVAIGLEVPRGIDVDSEHQYVYWNDRKLSGINGFGLVRRIKLPRMLQATTKPAPPLISAVNPIEQAAGAEVQIAGTHFTGVEQVEFVSEDGQHVSARFTVQSDSELAVVVPNLPRRAKRAAIIVQGTGGVTVTLPHACRVTKDPRTAFNRFEDTGGPPIVCVPGAPSGRVEKAVVYAAVNSTVHPGERGDNVIFLKNGCTMIGTTVSANVVYHEPFAKIHARSKASPDTVFVPVPAIRPSFVEKLFEFKN